MIQATSTPSFLSPEQIEHFHQQGYCVVDDVFSARELQDIEDFFEAFRIHGETMFEFGEKYEELDPKKQQVRVLHPHRYDRRVLKWYLKPELMEILGTLLGKPALGAQTMYYYKPPGACGQGMHQDNLPLQAAPATCIAAWTPIDDADEENGCLWVAPTSNKDDIYCPKDRSSPGWMDYGGHIKPFPRQHTPVPVPVKRGQTMIFGGNLIHGSGPNRSKDRSRRTFIGHYVDEATEEISWFYHPLLNAKGEEVTVRQSPEGGPCGPDFSLSQDKHAY